MGETRATQRATAEVGTAAPLDDIDLAIVRVLSEDGRVSFADLAHRVNVSRATAYTRITRMKEKGVVKGFSVQVDPKALGVGVAAFIGVRFDFHVWRSVADELRAMAEVEHYALVSGDLDMLVLVRAQTIETIRDVVLERLTDTPGVQSTTTFFVLDEMLPRRVVLPEDG